MYADRGHQILRKANQFAHNEVGEEINKKRETKDLGIETDSRTRNATMDCSEL